MRINSIRSILLPLLLITPLLHAEPTVESTMDGIISRLYAEKTHAELRALNTETILDFITPEERHILATRESTFTVNVPVTVTLMRSHDQVPIPFWIPEAGFKPTGDYVTSEWFKHEVWTKDYPAGPIELGINGFDNQRKAYFVAVTPKNPDDTLTITNLTPDEAVIPVTKEKTWMYRDWNDLYLDTMLEHLLGQQLITTFRGRGKSAHLIGAFRETPYPSSETPDQIVLTWSEDPKTTQTIQWRTNTTRESGTVRYQKQGKKKWHTTQATTKLIEDRTLINDRYIHRHTATLTDLKPDTTYTYQVGHPETNTWSEAETFTTAPKKKDAPFTFIYTGDTHNDPGWGELINHAFQEHPESDFYVIGGDIVDTGLNRAQWDMVHEFSKDVINTKPLTFSLGNHDDQDGLGVGMILDLFQFPHNGPEGVEPGRMFSLEYGNVQFLIVDVGTDVDTVAAWLEEVLSQSTATWKFLIFHFPLYGDGEDDYTYLSSKWAPIFDKYHLDISFNAHFHRYFRTHPIAGDKVVDDFSKGTVYLHTAGCKTDWPIIGNLHLAATHRSLGYLYQKITINGDHLLFQCFDKDNTLHDQFEIQK